MTATTDPTPLFISSFHPLTSPILGWSAFGQTYNPVANGWAANLAVYIPLRIPATYSCQRIWWLNGGVVSGNVDVGVYNEDFSIVSHIGSTAQVGTNVVQYASFTQTLAAGTYYLALTADNATGQYFYTSALSATAQRTLGTLQQTVFPLPNTMVPASPTTAWPMFGLTRSASGF